MKNKKTFKNKNILLHLIINHHESNIITATKLNTTDLHTYIVYEVIYIRNTKQTLK